MEKKKYYIVYKITNKINDNIYIGCHVTDKINDKYMGSGSNIKKAIKNIGRENFEKIILFNLDSADEMFNKEREIVNDEFIKRKDTYNIILGGGINNTHNTVTVKDLSGNTFQVHKTDPRYLNGELKHVMCGLVVVKNKNNDILAMSITDTRYLSGEFNILQTNNVNVKDKNGKKFRVSIDDPRYLNGELISISTGMINVKDIDGKIFKVDINDRRYLTGELIPIWCNKKHKEETKRKIGEKNAINHKGEKNSQYGKCWIFNEKLKENKIIKKEDIKEWIEIGWIKGRKMIF